MAYNTKIKLSNDKVCQGSGELLTLSGNTVIAVSGNLDYAVHPNFTGDTQVVDKKYVDDKVFSGVTGGTVYSLSSPATIDVGGVDAGTVLTGKNSNEILEEILTPYQVPTFTIFDSEMISPVEVGTSLSGVKEFSWVFEDAANVQASTMCIVDVNGATNIETNISTTSPQSGNIGTKTFTSCGQTFSWKGCATDTCSNDFGSSNHTITGLYPYFWGKCTCPGAAGASRPTLASGDIVAGTKVLNNSAGSFAIDFNSGDDDYLWFAVPSSVADKTSWCVDALNNGAIGGGVSAGCNLFPAGSLVNVTSAEGCWSTIAYDVYVSNKQTSQANPMTIG